MPSYTATIQLSGGSLTVTRPHPSTEDADDLIDNAIYAVRDPDTTVTSVGITIVTNGTPSTTPDPAAPEEDPTDPSLTGPLST